MKNPYIEIGYIADAFGIYGEVKAKLDVYDISEYLKIKKLLLGKKGATPQSYKIKEKNFRSETEAIFELDGIATREEAEALKGNTIFIYEADLPKLEDGRFYYFEVIGYTVQDKKLGELGTVHEILEMPAQDVMVMSYQDKKVMIPLVDEVVLSADKANKIMHTDLPDGLLELYLG
jgi:16S rRNA processing protein RimM